MRALLVLALVVAGATAPAPVLADDWVDVEPTGDAHGSLLAVSGTGNATCADAPCGVAISLAGNSTTDGCCVGGYSISGLGTARGGELAVSAFGDAHASGFYGHAVSGTGNGTAALGFGGRGALTEAGRPEWCHRGLLP